MGTLQQIIATLTALVTILSAQVANLGKAISPASQLAQVLATQSIDLQVGASSDDGWQQFDNPLPNWSTNVNTTGGAILQWQSWGAGMWGMRFNNIAIPKGATITNAYLQMYMTGSPAISNGWNHVTVTITGQLAPNASTFLTGSNNDLVGRSKTSSSVLWDNTLTNADAYNNSPSITGIIQEIVNQSDWANGNSVALFLQENSNGSLFSTYDYDNWPNMPARLHIEYTTSEIAVPSTPAPTADTQAPTIPTNLSASAVSSSQINLSWNASTDNTAVTGYRIYRAGTQIGTSATNSYSNTGLTASTAYTYTVSAYDAAGNVSSQSSSASATTQAASVPTPTPIPTPTPAPTSATAYYISTTGSDSNNGTSLATAWRTFAHAVSLVHPGDTVNIDNGVYYQSLCPVTSGTSNAKITWQAINDGAAVIDGQNIRPAVISIGRECSNWTGAQYNVFRGLVAVNAARDIGGTGAVIWIVGSHNEFYRVSAYNADPNSNNTVIWIEGTDNLVEDCAGGGYGRKMIFSHASPTQGARRNIIRRFFSAWQAWEGRDFDPGYWPWGDGIEVYGAPSTIIENSIAYGMAVGPDPGIGMNNQDTSTPVSNIGWYGNMAVNIGRKWDGTEMTWPNPDPYRSPAPFRPSMTEFGFRAGFKIFGTLFQNIDIRDAFAYGNGGDGLDVGFNSGSGITLLRGTFLHNALSSDDNGVDVTASTISNFNTITDTYIEGNNSYQGGGARLINRYESYFNGNTPVPTLTSTPLWPWPMESRIRSEFATYLYPRWGSINPELASFSVTQTMQGVFNSLPSAINPLGTGSIPAPSDTTAPSVPANLIATAISTSQINLSWTASTDNTGVTGYRIYRSGAQIGTSATNSYSDTGLSASTQYTYTVAAYDAANNVSSQSSSASATTQSTQTPVSTTFSAGDRVQVNVGAGSNLNVRQTASAGGTLLGTQTNGALGTIVSGGTSADSYYWWNVNFDSGIDGYAVENFLVDYVVPTPIPEEPVPTGPLSIGTISSNLSSVPRYSKFELTFNVNNTVATNLQLPFDANPPSGVSSNGISVDVLFTPDNWTTVYRQPAFYYQPYSDSNKISWDGATREWHYPNGSGVWKVRFSPNQTGTWQYRITAQDASGTAQSSNGSFSVVSSSNKGFVKVSPTDSRYFEFDDGTLFTALGFNDAVNLDDPVIKNQSNYQRYAQNGINFLRVWISGMFGSAWPEWLGGRNIYDGYLPRAGLEPVRNATTGQNQMAQVVEYNNSWYDACRFQFWNDPESVKTNTNYRLRIKYQSNNIAGPRVSGQTNYGLVGKISTSWVPNCEEPGTGTVITNYGQNTSGFGYIEGTWNSGSNNFLPRIYIGLENVTGGKAYIDSVSLQEILGNNQYGPEIINEYSMQYDSYFPQESSFSLDKLVELAEQNGIYLKLVLEDKNDLIYYKLDDDGTYVIGGESDNTDGFYGLGRTENKTKWLHEAYWRYLQARWGYSPSIHSWELTNEGDPWLTTHYQLTDELGKYMHCGVFGASVGSGNAQKCAYNHPNDHLVTTSFWTSFPATQFWGNTNYPNVDYADLHAYVSTSDIGLSLADRTKSQWDSAFLHLSHSSLMGGWELDKPVVRGELGIDSTTNQTEQAGLTNDNQGIWLHKLLWASVDSGAMSEMYWWLDNIRTRAGSDGQTGLYDVFGVFSSFIKNVPLNNGRYADLAATVSNANIRVVGQKDATNGNAHVWIDNINHTWKNVVDGVSVTPISSTISFSAMPVGTYTATWYNTYNGSVSSTENVSASNGTIILSVSNLSTDIAVKLDLQSSTPTPTPTPTPSTTFTTGQRVQANVGVGSNLNVRATASASGTLLGTQTNGALGTILSGGTSADGYYWWNVNWDSGADGWSVENYLASYTAPVPTPINGQCSTILNTCIQGTFSDVADTASNYLWNCAGSNGGTTASCSLPVPPPANQAPVLSAIGSKSVAENSTLSFTISATDANGDALTYSASSLPSGATFNSGTRAFSWTPSYNQSGSYTVVFSVSDGNNGTDSESVIITVTNTNRAPVASAGPDQSVSLLSQANLSASGSSDADGQTLSYTWSKISGPGTVTFSSATAISPTAAFSSAGTYVLRVSVSDGSLSSTDDTSVIVSNAVSTDDDVDGVANASDLCPGTPSNLVSLVNTKGCPLPKISTFTIKPTLTNTDLRSVGPFELGNASGKVSFDNNSAPYSLLKNMGSYYGQLDIDSYLKITPGSIELDSLNMPELNRPATLTFYNVYLQNPELLKDGDLCDACVLVSYQNSTLVFTVPSFSIYRVISNSLPLVSVTYPVSGSTLNTNPIVVLAAASDDLGVAGVKFLANNLQFGVEDTTAPYSASWNPNPGSYVLNAVARDVAGIYATSSNVSVTISAPAAPNPPAAPPSPPSGGGGGSSGGSSTASSGSSSGTSGGSAGASSLPTTGSYIPVASAYTFTRNLSRGSEGNDVMQLQNFLISQGYLSAGNTTGFFGSLTETALQSFQKAQGIVSSGSPATTGYGNFGPGTRAKVSALSGVSGGVQTAGLSTQQMLALIQQLQKQVQELMLKLQQMQQ